MTTTNFDKFLVDEPLRRNTPGAQVQNMSFPPFTYMSSDQVPEVKFHVEFGWVWGMPQPNPYDGQQVGEYDEILLNIGGNCRDPENLGADIEYNNIYIEGGWVWGMPEPNPHIMEHVHDYEELVLHFGNDYCKPNDLGGEIDFYVGGQPLTLAKTAMVYVPKSIPHGPLIWKKYSAPHLEMAIIPGAGTLDDADPGGHREKMKARKQGA